MSQVTAKTDDYADILLFSFDQLWLRRRKIKSEIPSVELKWIEIENELERNKKPQREELKWKHAAHFLFFFFNF